VPPAAPTPHSRPARTTHLALRGDKLPDAKRQVRPPAGVAQRPRLPLGDGRPGGGHHKAVALAVEGEALEARERAHGGLALAPCRLEEARGVGLDLEAVVVRGAGFGWVGGCASGVACCCMGWGAKRRSCLLLMLQQLVRRCVHRLLAHRFVLVKGPVGAAGLAGAFFTAPFVPFAPDWFKCVCWGVWLYAMCQEVVQQRGFMQPTHSRLQKPNARHGLTCANTGRRSCCRLEAGLGPAAAALL